LVGCETAEFLVKQGKKVTILEMLPKLGPDIGVTTRQFLLGRLREAGIDMHANSCVVEITANCVSVRRDGEVLSFAADSVVLAVGMRPNNELLEQLKGGPYELYSIGDCVEPRRIANAVAEATQVAYSI
ncbi:FAD/NAD(P)-binding oxidoreductase, partial [Chloroflexota bacterium]